MFYNCSILFKLELKGVPKQGKTDKTQIVISLHLFFAAYRLRIFNTMHFFMKFTP